MNYILLVVCFSNIVACSFATDDSNLIVENAQQKVNDCITSLHATEEDVLYLSMDWIPSTRVQACLITCANQKLGTAYKNATVNTEDSITRFKIGRDPASYTQQHIEDMRRIWDACNNAQPQVDDDCLATKIYRECYIGLAKKEGAHLTE